MDLRDHLLELCILSAFCLLDRSGQCAVFGVGDHDSNSDIAAYRELSVFMHKVG